MTRIGQCTRKLILLLAVSTFLSSCAFFPREPATRPAPAVLPAKDKPVQSRVTTTRFDSFNAAVFFDKAFIQTTPLTDTEVVGIGGLEQATQVDEPEVDVRETARDDFSRLIAKSSQEQLLHCKRIDRRLRSVTLRNCLLKTHHNSNYVSADGGPIYFVDFEPKETDNPLGKVLVLGGVHGDELTSVSTVYLWIQTLFEFHSGLFDWRVVPVVNPDGFFREEPSRTNANGIDLNRNMPTYQWRQLASRYWEKYASGTKRKFPGYNPASEPETQWLVNEINNFQPDVIVTVHAPYNLVDYDAADRANAPRNLGILQGRSLGTFPGSLGRYAGEERNIPVITLELPHSTKMPSRQSVDGIWLDLVAWLRQNINTSNMAGRSFNHCNASPMATGCI